MAALALVGARAWCADVPEPVDREAIIQEMLDRSRLLEDAQFRVARSVYERYVREALEPAKARPAPVAMIADEGVYALSLPADRKPLLAATLRLHVFNPEQCASVPVLSAAWAWEDVQVNGQPARLASDKGWLRLSATAAGPHVVTARVALREATASGGALRLDVPRTVRTLVAVDSPGAWEFALEGAAQTLRGAAEGTQGQLAVSPRNRLDVTYGPVLPVTERPPRYAVRGDVAWNLDSALQQVTAALDVGIMGGATERLELSLPLTAERVSVSGPDVREAQVTGGKATIFLRGKVRERTRLRVSYEMPLAKEGMQRLDPPALADGHWAGGTLVVSNSAGGVEVLPGTLSGLRQTAIADAAEAARALAVGTPAVACEIAGRSWTAEVELLNLAEFALKESIADLAHYELLFRDDGMLLCKASYEIRNRARQFLRLELPRGATVLQARVNEEPKPLTPAPDARDTYLVPLVRSVASVQGLVTFPVDVVFLCRIEGLGRRGDVGLPLPRIDLPIAYAWCEASVPEGMRVRRWTGPLAKVDRYSNETATASLDYGLGMAAEGYKPKERPIPPQVLIVDTSESTARPDEKPKPKAEPEPAKLPPPPPKTPRPRSSGGGLLGILRPRGTTTPEAPAVQPPAEQPPQNQDGQIEDTTVEDIPQSSLSNKLLLGRNYYRAGKESYEKGDYANAAKSLEQAIALNPKSQDAFNASKLLGNIKLVQPGQAGAQPLFKSQAEKVAGIQVKKQVKAGLKSLEQQQQEFLEKGLKAAEEGRKSEAQAQLGAAEALGEQLTAQGANKEEVESRLKNAKGTLHALRKQEKAQVEGLYKKVEELKGKGRYDEALKHAKEIQKLDTGGGFGGGKANLQTEIEELAVEATKQKAQQLVQHRANEPVAEQAQGQVTKRLSDLQEGWDVANGPAASPGEGGQGRGIYSGRVPGREDGEKRREGAEKGAPRLVQQQAERVDRLAQRQEEIRRVVKEPVRPRGERWGTTARPDVSRDDGTVAVPGERHERVRERRATHIGEEAVEEDLERRIREEMGKKVSFDFVETPLQDVIYFLSNSTDATIILDPDLVRHELKRVTLRVKNMDLHSALNWVSKITNARLVEKDGAVLLTRPEAISEKPALRMYDVTDLTIDIKDFQARRSAEPGELGYARSEHEALFRPVERAGLRESREGAERGEWHARAPEGKVLRNYDVSDLVRDGDEEEGKKLAQRVREAAGAGQNTPYTISYRNGRIVVVHAPEVQEQIEDLLTEFRAARGPQVQVGSQITLQKASGKFDDYSALTAAGFQAFSKGPAADPRLRQFVARNYAWQYEANGDVDATDRGQDADDIANFGVKLESNLEQKVQVNGINLNVAPGEANGIGVAFNKGKNDLSYAVVDEAQLKTLLELDAAKKRGRVAANPNAQETIVGTDAWLPNSMRANVRFAGDTGNTLDINGNPIQLAHQSYILINNGSYLTAVQANPMQHWTEAMNPLPFAVTAPEIEVPRVGRLVKFEKALVEPGDELVLRASYRYSQ